MQATTEAHNYQAYKPPPPQGKEVDWALLLKDASDGWMVSKRTPTWEEGRVDKSDAPTNKMRGFIDYERLALPYRDVKERQGDYGEVLAKLDDTERDHLLNTQVRTNVHVVSSRVCCGRADALLRGAVVCLCYATAPTHSVEASIVVCALLLWLRARCGVGRLTVHTNNGDFAK